MRSRVAVGFLVAACAGYLWISLSRALEFAAAGSLVGAAFALAIAALVLVSVILIIREIGFGRQMAAMAAVLEAEAGLLPDDLPRAPSGRIEQAAADARFHEVEAELAIAPDSWRSWYRVAVAYDDARDRRRARSAMRRAAELFRVERR